MVFFGIGRSENMYYWNFMLRLWTSGVLHDLQ
jgi:hypothetical protein